MRLLLIGLLFLAGCAEKESSKSTSAATTSAAPAIAPAPAKTENTLTSAELADGWILLFDGESLYGWDGKDAANWKVADGAITVSEGEKGLLTTTTEWGDYAF